MQQDATGGSRNLPLVSYLKLGPLDITIAVVPGLATSKGIYGDWDEYKRLIRLAGDQPPQSMAQTLLHELLHACSDLYYLRLSEQSIRCLENSITALLRDHPAGAREWLRILTT